MTYPIGEATSNGFINTCANLIGFVSLLALTPVLKQHQKKDVTICFIVFVTMILVALGLLIKAEIKLQRCKQEHQGDKEIIEENEVIEDGEISKENVKLVEERSLIEEKNNTSKIDVII